MPETHATSSERSDEFPHPAVVEDLIRRAEEHPLGLPFLMRGFHDSVAATFSVHAFVVDEARERLRGRLPRGD